MSDSITAVLGAQSFCEIVVFWLATTAERNYREPPRAKWLDWTVRFHWTLIYPHR